MGPDYLQVRPAGNTGQNLNAVLDVFLLLLHFMLHKQQNWTRTKTDVTEATDIRNNNRRKWNEYRICDIIQEKTGNNNSMFLLQPVCSLQQRINSLIWSQSQWTWSSFTLKLSLCVSCVILTVCCLHVSRSHDGLNLWGWRVLWWNQSRKPGSVHIQEYFFIKHWFDHDFELFQLNS